MKDCAKWNKQPLDLIPGKFSLNELIAAIWALAPKYNKIK